MTKRKSKLLAGILSVCMLISMVAGHNALKVRAEEGDPEPEPNPFFFGLIVSGAFQMDPKAEAFSHKVELEVWYDPGDGRLEESIEITQEPDPERGGDSAEYWCDSAEIIDEYFKENGIEASHEDVDEVKIKVSTMGKVIAFAEKGWDPEHREDLMKSSVDSEDFATFTYRLSVGVSKVDEEQMFNLALTYENEGDDRVLEYVNNFIYAYSDWDGDGDIDANDMKIGFACELSKKYFWAEGGILDSNFGINSPDEVIRRMTKMDLNGSITAKDAANANVSIARYDYEINLGKNHAGKDVTMRGSVYALPDNHSILAYTGSEYFVRDLENDMVSFSKNNDTNTAISIVADYDPAKLAINGDGGGSSESINNPEDDIYCIHLANNGDHSVIDVLKANLDELKGVLGLVTLNTSMLEAGYISQHGGTVRVMKPGKSYFVVEVEGESKNVAAINKDNIDSVCQAGSADEEKFAEVFVGNTAIHITPMAAEIGTGVTEITNVALKDEAMSDGVKVSKENGDDYKVEFLSKFYDNVPLLITYSDETQKEVSIHRIGLVIQTQRLDDSGNYEFFHGNDNNTNVKVDYDYWAGQQIIVYATYYHPSSDDADDVSLFVTYENGKTAVLEKYKYTPATATDVATTDFIIGFYEGKVFHEEDGSYGEDIIELSTDAFNALIMNAGFDSTEKFGGTQLGSGLGVYWDGDLSWNFN